MAYTPNQSGTTQNIFKIGDVGKRGILDFSALTADRLLKFPNSDGSANYYLKTDGAGNLSWSSVSAAPGGSTTQVQVNNAGAFAGYSSFTFDPTGGISSLELLKVGKLQFNGSGEITVTAATGPANDIGISGGANSGSGQGGSIEIFGGAGGGGGAGQGFVFIEGASVELTATLTNVFGEGSIRMATDPGTGTVTRFEITKTGEWQLAGSSGTAGNVLTSAGAGAPPTWSAPSGGGDSLSPFLLMGA